MTTFTSDCGRVSQNCFPFEQLWSPQRFRLPHDKAADGDFLLFQSIFIAARLIPRMFRERVFGMMDGDNLLRAEISADQWQFRRQRVNLRQVCIILSVLQYGKVDSGKFFTYLLEMRAIAAVAANVYLPSGQGDAGNGG